MYAKLVTKTTAAVGDIFDDVIGVITGSISNTSQLHANSFDISLSAINTTIPTGWEIWDDNAGAAISNTVPVVIRSAWSDSNNYHKYIWVGDMSGATDRNAPSTNLWMNWICGEGWNVDTNTGNNMFTTIPTTRNTNANFWYVVPYRTTQTTVPTTFIISASQTHLFMYIASTEATPGYSGHLFLSEYTRDEPWCTVENGFPSWYMEGCRTTSVSANVINGTIPRYLTTGSGVLNHYTSYNSTAALVGSLNNYIITTRLGQFGNTAATSGASVNPTLAYIGEFVKFRGENYNTLDANLTSSIPIGDLHLQPGYRLGQDHGMAGVFGSISDKTPYVRPFRSTWTNLDEINISGELWTLVKFSSGAAIVKQV